MRYKKAKKKSKSQNFFLSVRKVPFNRRKELHVEGREKVYLYVVFKAYLRTK